MPWWWLKSQVDCRFMKHMNYAFQHHDFPIASRVCVCVSAKLWATFNNLRRIAHVRKRELVQLVGSWYTKLFGFFRDYTAQNSYFFMQHSINAVWVIVLWASVRGDERAFLSFRLSCEAEKFGLRMLSALFYIYTCLTEFIRESLAHWIWLGRPTLDGELW